MFKFTPSLLLLLLLTVALRGYAQQTTLPGSAKGIVRDTAQNYVLKSATVSIYKVSDSTLLSYQVTNNYGEFSFKNLPVDLPLKLEVSHVGYLTGRKTFNIPSSKNTIDLEKIIMTRSDVTLDDVVISIPPISVNGDTLEFNAAAFKLDTNATVEDMLRAIPNVTLWGDGQITVNGAEVKSLKVNGKSFFGGDAKIALQNISKNALQKVQVYNTAKSQTNPLDSTLEMNLKLKKGKDIGFFGKVGVGYGTNSRYESDLSINMYSPKMELALVGAINNINKSAYNVQSLMANSTFKGVGTNVEYQPNFRESGLNQPGSAGASLTYNFIENPTYQKKSTLRANYFLQDRNSDYLSEAITTTTINSADQIFENSRTTNGSANTNHRFDSNYELSKSGQNLIISQSVNINRGENTDRTFRTAGNLDNAVTSTNNSFNTGNFNNKNFNLRGEYRYSPVIYTQGMRFKGLTANYNISGYSNDNQRLNLTEFRSFTNSAANQNFNRKYDTKTEGVSQEMNLDLNDIKSLLLKDKRLAGINFDLTNRLMIKSDKNDNRVQDLDTLTDTYVINRYLNNQVQTNVVEVTPGLRIEKSFYKSLSNRFHQNLTLRFHPKQLFVMQNNKSDRSFQNIKRNYQRFAPDGGVSYYDYQYGEYSRNYNLNYYTNIIAPSINQLAPLTDSSNVYYLQRGNINLREAIKQEMSFSFNHYDQSDKNALNYNFNVSAGMIKDNIVDSLLIDDQNRRTVYLVNADGNKYLNFYGDIRKAFKFKSSELQLSLNGNVNANRNPGYTNSLFTFSSNLNTNTHASINYTYKAYLALVLGQSYETYQSKQEAFDTRYSGKNLGTSVSGSYNITKKFTLNSNVSFNNSSSSSGARDINFTIWNASAVYRFLKGNNAEFKFSALDLLRQNNSAINYGNANSFTVGTQNVLTQYFMTTISYYPRQFGKKTPKK